MGCAMRHITEQAEPLYLATLGTVVGYCGRECAVRVVLSVDDRTATLAWLVSSLEHARTRGQTKVVGYLEAVLDDVVFEMESAARSQSVSRLRFRSEQRSLRGLPGL
jgi:hypothetical protein